MIFCLTNKFFKKVKGMYFILFFILTIFFSYGQNIVLDITEKDSINPIILDEVMVINPLKFNSLKDHIVYLKLKHRTLKVYPYAKLAAERLMSLNDRLTKIKSKSKRRKYMKLIQKFVEQELTEKLKKLTFSEGKILIKLIYRQTGFTCYELVKEYRNGMQAVIFQTTARFFKMSLKTRYDPNTVYEDFLIEDILTRAFTSREIDNIFLDTDYNYFDIAEKWQKNKAK